MRSSKYEVNPRQSKFERKLNEDSKISTEGDKKDEIKFSPNMNESTPRPNSSKSDEDEDKDDACNFCNFSFLEIISNYVNNFLQNSFYKLVQILFTLKTFNKYSKQVTTFLFHKWKQMIL